MNWWDNLVSVFAPRQAAQNAGARAALGHVKRMNGSRRRFGDSYGSAWERNTGRVEDALPRRVLDGMRIQRLLATNPYAAKVRATLLNNLIGFGITGAPDAPKKVIDAWKLWLRHADWMGRHDFYGLQDMAVGTMLDDGECFIVRRFDRSKKGVVPLRIDLLDRGMLFPGGSAGPIEYDSAGRPSKYHFSLRRNAAGSLAGNVVSFEAKDVIHLYRQERPGQCRGRSIFEPVIKRFEDMDDYIEAEVVRKKIEACFAAFITPSAEYAAEQTNLGAESDDLTNNDFEVEVFEPGMIERLRPGDDVKFGDPKPSAAIAEFARVTLLGATAGAGVPYEHGTGDLSNVNYSSYRAGSLEFQRYCGRLQWLQIIPIMLDRIWDWFLEDGFQTGMLGKRFYEIGWTPPAFESIDRVKDANADLLELAGGLTSHRKLVGARGEGFEDLMEEIAAERALIAKLGLKFSDGTRSSEPDPKSDDDGGKPNAVDD